VPAANPFASATAIRLYAIAGLLGAWEILARAFADPNFVATPSRVLLAFGPTILGDPKLEAAILTALAELLIAFVLAVAVGTGAGVLIGLTDVGRRSVFPIVLLFYALPQVVLLPLVVLVFGIGPPSRIFFGFSHGVLPVIVTTVAGMRNVDPLLIAGARTTGASQGQILRHIVFPNMIGTLCTGLRLAMTLTLLGVILAELFVSTNGIGNYTQLFTDTFKPASLFALIGTLAALAIVVNQLVRLVEARFTRWKQG
jgi:ABC-type nitrate/sulfonate/bicarbonate transport system permease component